MHGLTPNQVYALGLSFVLGLVGWLQLILLIRPTTKLYDNLQYKSNWFGLPFGVCISLLYWARLVFIRGD
jgi:hypothetical protein